MIKLIFIFLLLPSVVFAQAISSLTEDTNPTVDDLTVTVNNPGVTPATRKVTLGNIKTLMLNGNASTASALAANGTNCSAGNYPLGVDASGNSESCTAVPSEVTPGGATTQVQYNSAGSFEGSAELVFNGTNTGVGNTSPAAKLEVTQTAAADAFIVEDEASDTTPFVISANGNVGIGTLSTSNRLNVGAGSTGVNDEFVSINSGSGSGAEPQLRFQRNGVLKAAVYVKDPTETLYFYTAAAGDNFTMTQAGNVGIGTTVSDAKLQIVQTSAANAFEVNDQANDTTPFVIDANGNVAISTASAGATLVVNNTSNSNVLHLYNRSISSSGGGSGIIAYHDDNASLASGDRLGYFIFGGSRDVGTLQNASGVFSYATEAWSAGAASSDLRFETTTAGGTSRTEKMRIQDDGNIGIANTAPDAKLQITQTSAVDAFRVDDQASDTTPFVITSAGNVGIGSVTPAAVLDVTGAIRASTGTAGQAACWKADKTLGQCTSIVGAGGGCTCS